MKRKIFYITGTRADYGLMRSTLRRIHQHPKLSLDIAVTGMHLMHEFGNSINEIREDKFKYHTIDVRYESDAKESMAIFIGRFLQELVPLIQRIKPDIILVLGDRGEMLAGAIAGVYLGIPVAHIHGGEVTSTVDDYARHAITKLAQIHLPATVQSGKQISNLGESQNRIFVVGAPGLDQVLHEPLLPSQELAKKYNIDFTTPVILVIQHPVSLEVDDAPRQIRETLDAVAKTGYQSIIIYPNADAGGRGMIDVINEYTQVSSFRIFPNIPHKDYLSLLRNVSVLVGNSSSAIIEAPSFCLPAVNIGTRQNGRERGENIIDAPYNKEIIAQCIDRALYDTLLLEKIKKGSNPYGDGNTSERIVEILSTIDLSKDIFIKNAANTNSSFSPVKIKYRHR